MNFDDYENLPNARLSVTMFAGASAGIMEHISMYPVDTIKVMYFRRLNARDSIEQITSNSKKRTNRKTQVENGREKRYYINTHSGLFYRIAKFAMNFALNENF